MNDSVANVCRDDDLTLASSLTDRFRGRAKIEGSVCGETAAAALREQAVGSLQAKLLFRLLPMVVFAEAKFKVGRMRHRKAHPH
jgi:hypothetical protein